MARIGKAIGSATGKFAKRLIVDAKEGPAWHNLYTGKKMNNNPLLVGGVAVAALAYGSAQAEGKKELAMGQLKRGATYDVGYLGKPDILEADGVGSGNAPRNLNAEGSIVFGLHNGRRG
jgi:hypothetical protein